jgi:predicted nuclease with TOPRIM domain
MSTQPVSNADKLPQPGSPEWLRDNALGWRTPTADGLRAAAERIEQLADELDRLCADFVAMRARAEKAEAERDRLREDLSATVARLGDAEQERDGLKEQIRQLEHEAWLGRIDREMLDWIEKHGLSIRVMQNETQAYTIPCGREDIARAMDEQP